jgi:hypothetical protein
MRRSIILTAAAASVSLAAWCGSASAQSIGSPSSYDPYFYGYSGNGGYGYNPRAYSPRVYGYTRRGWGYGPGQPGGCGMYRFWNGYRCADARYE